MGDSAGIGPEIIAKAFKDHRKALENCFVVGDVATLRRAAQVVVPPGQGGLPVAQIAHPQEALRVPPRCIPVLPLPGLPPPLAVRSGSLRDTGREWTVGGDRAA